MTAMEIELYEDTEDGDIRVLGIGSMQITDHDKQDHPDNPEDWKNKFDLEKTISWTIDWYKKFLNDEDMREYSDQQIENFTLL